MKVRNVVIALVLVAVLIAGGFAYLASVFVNTDGVSYRYRGIEGGTQANSGRGDLLDSTAYVTSWTGGGVSEKIVLRGHWRATPQAFDPSFARYWYQVSLTSDNPSVQINGITGTSWASQKFENSQGSGPTPWSYGDWVATESVVVTLTNPCSGKIHVELWGHVNDLNPSSSDDGILASDEAYLRSGIGSVKVQNDVVEEGTMAHFFVETGYAQSAKTGSEMPTVQGWILNIYNPAGGSVFTKTIGDNFAGTIDWFVPNGSYSPTSTNVWKVLLRNLLIDQDDDWFFTVGAGMMKQIPNKPSFKLENPKDTYIAGDQIKVTISATKNPIGYPIAGFWVWVSYETSAGTTTNYLIEKAWYPATADGNIYSAQLTFTFPDAGNARLEASAADTHNLNSGISEMSWTVYGPTDNHNNNNNNPNANWFLIILAILGVLGAIVLGAILIWYMPKPYGIVVGIVVILIGLALGLGIILSGVG